MCSSEISTSSDFNVHGMQCVGCVQQDFTLISSTEISNCIRHAGFMKRVEYSKSSNKVTDVFDELQTLLNDATSVVCYMLLWYGIRDRL